MGTTSDFLKLRSSGAPKTGEWNVNYNDALVKAKAERKYIITFWSNGDLCDYCVKTEKCMMTDVFKGWMSGVNAYFVFQCSADKDKGKTVHDCIYNNTKVTLYPGFRITLYDTAGKILCDRAVDGNKLRNNKCNEYGARDMISNLEAIMSLVHMQCCAEEEQSQDDKDYKVRFNEKLTVAKINKILDAIDSNDGYCPCQPRGEGTKCHCEDFINNKEIGEPCICKIYVKQSKFTKKVSKKTAKKSSSRKRRA